MTNNKIDKIIKVLDKDIKYMNKNKLFNEKYRDAIKMRYDLINRKLSIEEIDNLYQWIC